jgi:DNA-binding transcriptional LysR family regulator
VFLRQLEYLTALARERHFGRAALACQVSQPALSTGISKLERELGIPLVSRGHRYDDLTPEGHALLRWAHQAQAGVTGLETEAAWLRKQMTGTLRLGVIPTAIGVTPLIAGPLLGRFPDVRLQIRSLSSREIGHRLRDFELDAGITYLDNEPLGDVESTPVYTERYVFLTSTERTPGGTIDWAELADRPLCLLTTDMQNRRIIDSTLDQVGVAVTTRVEADSISALLSFARAGWSCVMAQAWLAMQGSPAGMLSVELVNPTVTHQIGLVTRPAEVQVPTVRLLKDTLREIDVDAALARRAAAAAAPANLS